MYKPTNNDLELMVKWCIKKFGYSKYAKGKPKIKFRPFLEKKKFDGRYIGDLNLIEVNPNNSIEFICATVVHELTHYKQNMYKYNILFRRYDYDNHPLEIKANAVMDKYSGELYEWFNKNRGKDLKLKDIK